MKPHQYKAAAVALRDKASAIAEGTVFRTYSQEVTRILMQSEFYTVLPRTIANMIIAGFPEDNKHAAISSAELAMYLAEAQSVLALVSGFVSFSRGLGVRQYDIPPGTIAIDIKIPRSLAANNLNGLSERLQRVHYVFTSMTELTTGERRAPELIYISTTDPIATVAILYGAAHAILSLYMLLLEVAEKQISVNKAIKELKNSGISGESVESATDSMQRVIKESAEKAVTQAFAAIQSTTDAARRNELLVEVGKQSMHLIGDIAGGMRINVSVESQSRVFSEARVEFEEGPEMLEKSRAIEARLDGLVSVDEVKQLVVVNRLVSEE